jgi:hypothetical protein
MLRLLLLLALIVIAVSAAIWVLGGRRFASVLDRVVLTRCVFLPVNSLNYDGGGFVIGNVSLTFCGADNLRTDVELPVDGQRRVVLTSQGLSFTLGPRTDPEKSGGQPEMSFIPEVGDALSLTFQRAALGWPTPFEFNFFTSNRPWWKRYCYYRLRWQKPGGSMLEMLWRYEQQYYRKRGWTRPTMMYNSATGLVRVRIRAGNHTFA